MRRACEAFCKKVFRSLRIGGVGIYNRSLFPDIFCASAFDIVPENEYSGHEKEVIRAFEKGMVVCVHMHHALIPRLDWLDNMVKEYGADWLTLNDVKFKETVICAK